MANIKNWSEFLKEVPTDVLLSEIENRKKSSYKNVSVEATNIMKQIDDAIKDFGEYSFDDKGPWEVMDIKSIKKKLTGFPSNKSIKEIASVLSEILDNYSDKVRGAEVVNCLIGEFDDLPEDEFDELLDSDERFEY
jgi:hypothetical protein